MNTSLVLCALLLGASIIYGQATPTPATPPDPNPPAPASPSTPSTSDATVAKMKIKREKQFTRLDANKDEHVDREEFKKGRFAQKNVNRAEKRFARSDKNGDGKLSKDEWLAAPMRGKKGKAVS